MQKVLGGLSKVNVVVAARIRVVFENIVYVIFTLYLGTKITRIEKLYLALKVKISAVLYYEQVVSHVSYFARGVAKYCDEY